MANQTQKFPTCQQHWQERNVHGVVNFALCEHPRRVVHCCCCSRSQLVTRLHRTRPGCLPNDTGILLLSLKGSRHLRRCCVEGSGPRLEFVIWFTMVRILPARGSWQPKLPWSPHFLFSCLFLLDPLRVMFQVWRVLMLHFVMDYRPFHSILMDCGELVYGSRTSGWIPDFHTKRSACRWIHGARVSQNCKTVTHVQCWNSWMDARRSVSEVRGELATPKTALMALSSARPRRYSNISPGSTED